MSNNANLSDANSLSHAKAENLQLSDLVPGLSRQFVVTITADMLDNFAVLSGDYNPLHMDERYAASTKFKKRVVHGMLMSSFFSRIVGMHLPGKKALYLTQNLKFKNPAFIGDILTVKGKITAVSEKLKLISLETVIINQNSEVIVEGDAKVSYL